MIKRKIHNDYFLKKDKSKIDIQKRNIQIPINKSNSWNKNDDLYKEIINYNIESNQTMESEQKRNESISISNKKAMSINKSTNSHKFNTININVNSNTYVRNLENQIKDQKKKLSQLLEYKNICEKKIKSLSPEEVLPLTIDSLNPNFYTNRSEKNIKNISKVTNSSHTYQNATLDIKNKNNAKTLDFVSCNCNEYLYKTKYIDLYKKYTKILKENKKYNINIIKLKNIIDKQKTENEYIKYLLKLEKDKIKENINEKILNDSINEWKERAEIFRKDLVLSQALVNSLKSEIQTLNKNNLIKRDLNNGNNNISYLDNNNKLENDDIINENKLLKKSLKEKNILISNLLEENYKINDIIKSLGININDYNGLYQNKSKNNENNLSLIKEMTNVISQYEEKFEFFNDYINKIKNEINSLFNDINKIVNDSKFEKENSNNQNNLILSENFYLEINNIKNQIKDINIDSYNLDYSNDIKCFYNYKKLMEIIIEELNKLILINKNLDLINEKENKSLTDLLIDIFNINKKTNQLYKQKILSNQNYNNNDNIISNQEKEFEKKKKSLLNNSNRRKTYYITSNNNYKSKNRAKNENKLKNTCDYNHTNYKNCKKNYYRNNKSLEVNNVTNTYKKTNNFRDKIILD